MGCLFTLVASKKKTFYGCNITQRPISLNFFGVIKRLSAYSPMFNMLRAINYAKKVFWNQPQIDIVNSYLRPSLIFSGKARSLPKEGSPVSRSPHVIRQGWKCPTVTNTLAYCSSELFTVVKKFYSACPWDLFKLYWIQRQGKETSLSIHPPKFPLWMLRMSQAGKFKLSRKWGSSGSYDSDRQSYINSLIESCFYFFKRVRGNLVTAQKGMHSLVNSMSVMEQH